MDYIKSLPMVAELVKDTDHFDDKTTECRAALLDFVHELFNYQPWFYRALMRVRGVVAKLLGLRHEAFVRNKKFVVPTKPGDPLFLFVLHHYEPDRLWIAEGSDKHLKAYLGIAAEPKGESLRFHVFTIVKYRHWTGPLYFNLIRPFHHLIVGGMTKNAGRVCRKKGGDDSLPG